MQKEDIMEQTPADIKQEATTPEVDVESLQASNEALKNKNVELLDELKQLRNSVKELGGIETIRTTLNELKSKQVEKYEQENSIEQLKQHYQDEIEKARKKNQELIDNIVQSNIDQQLRSAVTKNKGSYTLLEPQLRRHVKGEYVDGKVVVKVVDERGLPFMVEGKEAGISDLVAHFKTQEEFSRAFDVTPGITGSGAPATGGNPSNPVPTNLSELTALYQKNPARALEAMRSKGILR